MQYEASRPADCAAPNEAVRYLQQVLTHIKPRGFEHIVDCRYADQGRQGYLKLQSARRWRFIITCFRFMQSNQRQSIHHVVSLSAKGNQRVWLQELQLMQFLDESQYVDLEYALRTCLRLGRSQQSKYFSQLVCWVTSILSYQYNSAHY